MSQVTQGISYSPLVWCPYCQVLTDGSHADDCPAMQDRALGGINVYVGRNGWVCPKCDRVYSPSVSECWECNRNRNWGMR